MKQKDRYDTADLDENQFEPVSRRRMLKNLLHIISKREMDRLEGREQMRALEELASLYDCNYQFTAPDVCRMHQLWLGSIYPWAGKYRQVNVMKETFLFAVAAQITQLMEELGGRSAQTAYALPSSSNKESRRSAVRGARGVSTDSSLQRGQWSSGENPGCAHGTASGIACSVF